MKIKSEIVTRLFIQFLIIGLPNIVLVVLLFTLPACGGEFFRTYDNKKYQTYSVSDNAIHSYDSGETFYKTDQGLMKEDGTTLRIKKRENGLSVTSPDSKTSIYTKGAGNSVTEFDTSSGKTRTLWVD